MTVNVFIQNRKNSKLRSKFNEKTLEFLKEEELLSAATYQYGFIPGTIGEDGDCLDAWLISDTDFKVGTQVSCRILGMLEMIEEYQGEKEEDVKVFVCPEDEDYQLTETVVTEIKQYTLSIFRKFPEVTVTFGDFLPAEKAIEFIRKGQK
ncbi:MAG: inorganic diphosphatase [Spirochaetales bacterium]|nr:inorganic diphosphatase [Spirochaetales bacterium]